MDRTRRDGPDIRQGRATASYRLALQAGLGRGRSTSRRRCRTPCRHIRTADLSSRRSSRRTKIVVDPSRLSVNPTYSTSARIFINRHGNPERVAQLIDWVIRRPSSRQSVSPYASLSPPVRRPARPSAGAPSRRSTRSHAQPPARTPSHPPAPPGRPIHSPIRSPVRTPALTPACLPTRPHARPSLRPFVRSSAHPYRLPAHLPTRQLARLSNRPHSRPPTSLPRSAR